MFIPFLPCTSRDCHVELYQQAYLNFSRKTFPPLLLKKTVVGSSVNWGAHIVQSITIVNIQHYGGEPEQADIISLMSKVTHQVKHPPTCMHIHLPFTGGFNAS